MEETSVEVLDPEYDHVGIVNVSDMKCFCVGNSHGMTCVCSQVASLILSNTNDTSCQIVCGEVSQCISDGPVKEDTRYHIEQKLNDINSWVESSIDKCTDTKLRKVHMYLDQVHKVIFSQHVNVSRKRRQEILHPWRKMLRVKKKASSTEPENEHQYSVAKHKKMKVTKMLKNVDGSFKMSNRSKGAQRASFQK